MSQSKVEPPAKKAKTDAPSEEDLLKAVEDIQEKIEAINDEASKEIVTVEKKYNLRRKPVFTERGVAIRKIPNFWKTAFLNHPSLVDVFTDDDQKVLDFVEELVVEDPDDKQGWKIIMKFKANPWFKNDSLFKEVIFDIETGDVRVSASKVEWKDGNHDLSKRGDDNFFAYWFRTDDADAESAAEDGVAEILKEDIWLHPSRYYVGLSPEEIEKQFPGEYEDGEDDDEDEDGEEEEYFHK